MYEESAVNICQAVFLNYWFPDIIDEVFLKSRSFKERFSFRKTSIKNGFLIVLSLNKPVFIDVTLK